MGLLPTNQRDQGMIAVGVISLMLAAAFYSYVYSPKSEELSKIEERVTALETANDKAKVEVARGRDSKELRAQAEMYKQNLELMRQLVPTGNEVPALLEQVSTAARRVGLDIGAVEPEPVIPGDEFDTYRYKISIVGGYNDVGEFLTNVGSLTRIVAPVNLKLTPSTNAEAIRTKTRGGQSVLQSDFEMQTYVAKVGAPEPTRARAGAKS
jgi:type IV pilus assembly protein PilO